MSGGRTWDVSTLFKGVPEKNEGLSSFFQGGGERGDNDETKGPKGGQIKDTQPGRVGEESKGARGGPSRGLVQEETKGQEKGKRPPTWWKAQPRVKKSGVNVLRNATYRVRIRRAVRARTKTPRNGARPKKHGSSGSTKG